MYALYVGVTFIRICSDLKEAKVEKSIIESAGFDEVRIVPQTRKAIWEFYARRKYQGV